jgi:hypothetical protein
VAEGVDVVTSALQAMKDGTGDYEAVKSAVEAATFDVRPIHRLGDPLERTAVPGAFEDAVTPWAIRGVLSREQWKELAAIWRAKPAPPQVET